LTGRRNVLRPMPFLVAIATQDGEAFIRVIPRRATFDVFGVVDFKTGPSQGTIGALVAVDSKHAIALRGPARIAKGQAVWGGHVKLPT